ncbi:50S ribosomal protein L22 [bacterium E08(2017)]|nr:50S ribosomal protein L22 [bacterium E08(2017)]
MDVTAKMKFARLSPSKGREIARQVQGKKASEALKIVDFSTKKAALLIGKTLKSAIANAENNAKLNVDDLVVKEAVVDEGPRMRRYWARARGSVSPIRRRMSNIKVVLTDGKNED